VALRHKIREPSGAPAGGSSMKKIFALFASLAAFGLVLAPAARAEDTMMKKDETHMSKPMHHMKKDTMMHKDNMKGDKMMKDDAPKT
jgi:pentapeptide MXKDX repeat protein